MAKQNYRKNNRSFRLPTTPLGWVIFVLLILVGLTYTYQREIRSFARDLGLLPSAVVADGLTVTYIDIGQGDAALLQSGEMTMLIDGGTRDSAPQLMEALERNQVYHLDYLVATHPHEDHIGGLPTMLETVTVDTCLMPDSPADTRIYERFLDGLEEVNAAVEIPEVGDTYSFGDCEFTVLAPLTIAKDQNNNSLVISLSCGERTFLFTGDMESDEEEELLASGADLSADVLKVSHHGSAYTTSSDFLEQVNPLIAVISCGAGNDYGHPHKELMQRLEYRQLEIYRTDLMGEIVIHCDGEQLDVVTEVAP